MGNGQWSLSAAEVRVLGGLLEKQRTTPEMYPLTLNALRHACNQSTSRDPVVEYDDAVIRDALHRLERRGLTRLASGQGSRAPKYRHLLADALPMDESEQALICVLMLRGPQTPGELKQRAERMHAFASLEAVHEALACLIDRGLASVLERRPGQKEERYAQLLQEHVDSSTERAQAASVRVSGTVEPSSLHRPEASDASGAEASGRDLLHALGERVARLEREVAELRQSVQATDTDERLHTVRS